MAIDKPRIAGQPAVERQNALDQRFAPRAAPPTEAYRSSVDGAAVNIEAVTPQREGQLSFVILLDDSGRNRSCAIYAAVDISGTLAWKRITPVPNIINRYTGKPYDPIYD